MVLVASWLGMGVVAIIRWRRARSVAKPGRVRSDTKSWYDLALQGVGMAVVWTFRRLPGAPLIPGWPSGETAAIIVGAFFAVVGAAFASWAIVTLDRQYAIGARVQEGTELVQTGPFAYVRNPVYVGLLGLLLATGLMLSVWQAVVAGLVLYVAGTYLRARREEALLRSAFGAAYDAWAARVPLLVPRFRAPLPPN